MLGWSSLIRYMISGHNAQASLLWVSTLPGVTVDSKHIAAAVGISDGGAPAVATGTRYTAVHARHDAARKVRVRLIACRPV